MHSLNVYCAMKLILNNSIEIHKSHTNNIIIKSLMLQMNLTHIYEKLSPYI
jgi:hypothetical protein